MKQIRSIGIFAHVDAGKTTLSEQLLSRAGAIHSIGKYILAARSALEGGIFNLDNG